MISLAKRIDYATAYLELGMLDEAGAELEAVDECDRHRPEYFSAKVRVHLADRQWELVIRFARILTLFKPLDPEGWIAWSTALHAIGKVKEARDVLLEAEPLHGATNAVLHYHLSSYCRLMGDQEAANEHFAIACRLDPAGAVPAPHAHSKLHSGPFHIG